MFVGGIREGDGYVPVDGVVLNTQEKCSGAARSDSPSERI